MRASTTSLHIALATLTLVFQPVASGAAEGVTPIWRVPLDSLTETRERPLFSKSRRPPPKPVAAPVVVQAPAPPAPPPPPEPISMSLLGIVQGPNELNLAVVREDQSQIVKRLQVGESLNNWTLTEVRRREVTFKRAAEVVTLEMPKPGSAAAIPSPVNGMPPGMNPQLPPGMMPTQRGGAPPFGRPPAGPLPVSPQMPGQAAIPFPRAPDVPAGNAPRGPSIFPGLGP